MIPAVTEFMRSLPVGASAGIFLVMLTGMIILGVPVTIAVGLSSVIYMVLYGVDIRSMLESIMIPLQSFPLLGVYLFTFMGVVFETAGLSKVIVEALEPLVGRVKGGLGVVLIVGCAFYGLLTGSVAATAAAFAFILGSEMIKRGYDKEYTGALIASSSPLGAFIPPSIPAIIIATQVGGSVITMFMVGGAVGVVVMTGLIILNLIVSYRRGYGALEKTYTTREVVVRIAKAIPLLAVPLSVLGSIYLGVFSVTEAGALGAIMSLIVAAGYGRLRDLRKVIKIFVDSGKTTAVVMFLIVASYILSYSWSLAGINNAMLEFLLSIARSYSPYVALSILAAILFVLGMFFDVIVLAVAWGAVVATAFASMGFSIYHIGSIFLTGVLVGTATPPVGAAVFVAADALKLEVEKLIKGMKWFYVYYLVIYMLVVFVPDISLWLPKLLGLRT